MGSSTCARNPSSRKSEGSNRRNLRFWLTAFRSKFDLRLPESIFGNDGQTDPWEGLHERGNAEVSRLQALPRSPLVHTLIGILIEATALLFGGKFGATMYDLWERSGPGLAAEVQLVVRCLDVSGGMADPFAANTSFTSR